MSLFHFSCVRIIISANCRHGEKRGVIDLHHVFVSNFLCSYHYQCKLSSLSKKRRHRSSSCLCFNFFVFVSLSVQIVVTEKKEASCTIRGFLPPTIIISHSSLAFLGIEMYTLAAVTFLHSTQFPFLNSRHFCTTWPTVTYLTIVNRSIHYPILNRVRWPWWPHLINILKNDPSWLSTRSPEGGYSQNERF